MNLRDLQWQRYLTSLWLTAGGWQFVASIAMLTLCVGMTERLCGSFAAMKLFLSCHVSVLTTMSVVIVLLASIDSSPSLLALANGHDVGPSAGYYGCLGAILVLLPSLSGRPIFLCVFAVLLIRLIISVGHLPEDATSVSADLAHLLALPLGASLTRLGYVAKTIEVRDSASKSGPDCPSDTNRPPLEGDKTASKSEGS